MPFFIVTVPFFTQKKARDSKTALSDQFVLVKVNGIFSFPVIYNTLIEANAFHGYIPGKFDRLPVFYSIDGFLQCFIILFSDFGSIL